jgi:hypothetical protein
VGELADRLGRDPGLTLGVVEGVALDLGLIGVVVARRALDERPVLEARGNDLAPDCVGQGDVAADVEAKPDVGPLGGARPARVNRVEAGAVADAAEEMVEEDRMRLAGITAPEDDQIGVLDLTI